MSKWFDANGTDVDAYPDRAFQGGVYNTSKSAPRIKNDDLHNRRPQDKVAEKHDGSKVTEVRSDS